MKYDFRPKNYSLIDGNFEVEGYILNGSENNQNDDDNNYKNLIVELKQFNSNGNRIEF